MHSRTIVRPPEPSRADRRRTTLGVTEEVLQGSRVRLRRLMIAGFAFSLVMSFTYLGLRVAGQLTPVTGPALQVGLAFGFAIAALGYWFAERARTTERQALYFGIGLSVLACAVTGTIHPILGFARFGHVSPFGPHTLLVLATPLVLLTPPRLTAWMIGLSSLGLFSGWFAVDLLNITEVSGGEFLELAGAVLGAGTLAYVTNLVTYGLHKEVVQARQLGSYQLVSRIGAGGMGEVWRAEHDMLARPAAVKIIQPDRLAEDPATRESATQRFAREAQVTATLESPHTVRLFDFGRTKEGTFYYAMELLDGVNLEELVAADGAQPPERVQAIMRQVCDSIAEAHTQGLVHRDIKPGNIMLCRLGRHHDFVKVLDFGLVALQEEVSLDSTEDRLTRVGQIVGTPGFMSPESLMGMPHDARSDIYALGCLMFFLLTGRRVHPGANYEAIAWAHVTADVPSLYEAGARTATGAWQQVVADCLQKEPGMRPATVDDLLMRLEALPVSEPWTPGRAEEWWTASKALDQALKPHAPTIPDRPSVASG